MNVLDIASFMCLDSFFAPDLPRKGDNMNAQIPVLTEKKGH